MRSLAGLPSPALPSHTIEAVNAQSPLTSRLQGFGASIFAEMTALAVSTGSINLGQGFPDYDGPAEVLQIARDQIGRASCRERVCLYV